MKPELRDALEALALELAFDAVGALRTARANVGQHGAAEVYELSAKLAQASAACAREVECASDRDEDGWDVAATVPSRGHTPTPTKHPLASPPPPPPHADSRPPRAPVAATPPVQSAAAEREGGGDDAYEELKALVVPLAEAYASSDSSGSSNDAIHYYSEWGAPDVTHGQFRSICRAVGVEVPDASA